MKITYVVNYFTFFGPANSRESLSPVSCAFGILFRRHVLLFLAVLLLLSSLDNVVNILAVRAEPLVVVGDDVHLETLEVESHLTLITDEDGVWVVFTPALVTTTILALLLLVIHARLAFWRMLSRHRCIHLVLKLLIPVLQLDRLL